METMWWWLFVWGWDEGRIRGWLSVDFYVGGEGVSSKHEGVTAMSRPGRYQLGRCVGIYSLRQRPLERQYDANAELTMW